MSGLRHWFDVRDLGQVLVHIHDAEIEIVEAPPPRDGANVAPLTRAVDCHDEPAKNKDLATGLLHPQQSQFPLAKEETRARQCLASTPA
jgi:hypothetical protein